MVEKPTFEKIVSENASFVRRTLGQLGVPTRCLADVEQEVYRGVYRGLPAFDPALAPQPEGAIRSWLFGICERQAANHRRSEIRRGEILVTVEELDTAFDAPSTEDSLIEAERKALLHRLLATLEPRRRAVVVAYELEGIPMSEVAAAIGIPVNTAWNRLRLAREDLREAWNRLAAQRGRRPATVGERCPAIDGERRPAIDAGRSPAIVSAMGATRRPGIAASNRGAADGQSARDAALPPLSVILGSKAFGVDPAAPLWLKVPVVKVAFATGAFGGASAAASVAVAAAGVAIAAAAWHGNGALPASFSKDPPSFAAAALPAEDKQSADDRQSADDGQFALDMQFADDRPSVDTAGVVLAAGPSGTASSRQERWPVWGRGAAAVGSGSPAVQGDSAKEAVSGKGTGPSVDLELKTEVAELKAATEAFEEGDARLAIRLLAVHEKAFPNGRMAQDRELLRLRALMSEGRRNEARDCARRYLAAHPESTARAAIEATVGRM